MFFFFILAILAFFQIENLTRIYGHFLWIFSASLLFISNKFLVNVEEMKLIFLKDLQKDSSTGEIIKWNKKNKNVMTNLW